MLDKSESPPRLGSLSPPRLSTSAPTKRSRPVSREIPKLGSGMEKIRLTDEPQYDPELESLEGDIEQLRKEERWLREESRKLEDRIGEMRRRIDAREKRQKELRSITKELAVAQRFLSTADSLPQAEVVHTMEVLNEEIFQLTSIVADTILMEEKMMPTEKISVTYQRHLARYLEADFFLEIIAPRKLDDTLAIQVTWQALLVRWCSGVIGRWMLAGSDEVNNELAKMYEGIVVNDGQAIAGQWRAIACRNLQRAFSVNSARLIELVIKGLAAVPILCGYLRSQQQYDDLVKAFQPRVGQLLDKCFGLRKMVGEGFISVDIWPYFSKSGERFDPRYADLEYGGEEPAEERGPVAYTLNLGLFKRWKTKDEDGNVTESREPILKPKVVLQETLIEIIS